ncbi:ethylmalonyl-CoA decarboxylase isoform X2 [Rhinoraja longicauda]
MAMLCVYKCVLCSLRNRILQQRSLSTYTSVYRVNEDDIKGKLEQLHGGSIDLQKDQNGIATMIINNPERMNAFSGTMMLDFREKVEELEHWTDGKGLILRGANNTFCSGSDLKAVKAMLNPEDGLKMCMFMQNTLTRLLRLPLISVALVQGKALGGGAEVTTACDFRGDSRTRFGNSSAQDRKALQRVVRSAERTMGTTLAPLQDLYIRTCRSRASKIMRDPYHPSNGLFQLLRSGKRLRCHAVKTERKRRSFFPQAIRTVNYYNSRD